MKTPHEQLEGVVAILDALGAAAYTDVEIGRFLDSRELVLRSLNQKAEAVLGRLKAEMISTFTFNDTILIVLKLNRVPNVRDVRAFFLLLRKFLVDSLANRILFRGVVSIGSFYLNEETNSVMGDAVTDAAAWYDRANWIGINATPRASVLIDQLLETQAEKHANLLLDYEVPMKDRSAPKLKVVNWPKAFFVDSLSPCAPGESRRAKVLELLGQHRIPLGVEDKYFNSIAFYDQIVKSQGLVTRFGAVHPSKPKRAG